MINTKTVEKIKVDCHKGLINIPIDLFKNVNTITLSSNNMNKSKTTITISVSNK